MDIPAHRRIRILRAVFVVFPKEYMWIVLGVLFQDYCVRWAQTKNKIQDKVENLKDIALELFVELEPEFQVKLNFLLIRKKKFLLSIFLLKKFMSSFVPSVFLPLLG